MKRRVHTFPDGSQTLLCETEDGKQTMARRGASWETWSPPVDLDYDDDDPPEAVRREQRYLAEKDPIGVATLVAIKVVEALRHTYDSGVGAGVLGDMLQTVGETHFPDGLWAEIVRPGDDG